MKDTIDEFSIEQQIGEITAERTLVSKNREIENCDIEIEINSDKMNNFMSFIKKNSDSKRKLLTHRE